MVVSVLWSRSLLNVLYSEKIMLASDKDKHLESDEWVKEYYFRVLVRHFSVSSSVLLSQ